VNSADIDASIDFEIREESQRTSLVFLADADRPDRPFLNRKKARKGLSCRMAGRECVDFQNLCLGGTMTLCKATVLYVRNVNHRFV
jgi:hypothetical protein